VAIPAVGDVAPDFELPTDSGKPFRLSAQRGHAVVLYFYPEDDTEGCTIENIEFTRALPAFRRLGIIVVGISPDSVDKHCRFKEKHGLRVVLAADPDHVALAAYGVWGVKKTFGHEHLGVKRTTFLVAPDGRVAAVWPVTRIKGHAARVLDAGRALSAKAT
jgi:peroxiredoxin Q/BCP